MRLPETWPASCESRTNEVLDQVVSSVAETTPKLCISQKMLRLPHFSALGRATKAPGEIRRPDHPLISPECHQIQTTKPYLAVHWVVQEDWVAVKELNFKLPQRRNHNIYYIYLLWLFQLSSLTATQKRGSQAQPSIRIGVQLLLGARWIEVEAHAREVTLSWC